MKIAICGSLNFTYEIEEIADYLKNIGFEVSIPISSRKILKGEVSLDQIKEEKKSGQISNRAIEHDVIREYWKIIKNSDVVLIVNFDKNGIKNYIGGNTFLEMGFAHVLNRKIYLLNEIPEMLYSHEIKAMQPILLNGNLSKIT